MSNTATKDKYDNAIDYLNKNPTKIWDAWNWPYTDKNDPLGCGTPNKTGGELFKCLGPAGKNTDVSFYGCLTQIKSDFAEFGQHTPDYRFHKCISEEIRQKINNDPRIPTDVDDITVEHLAIFAEYQREADKIRAKAS